MSNPIPDRVNSFLRLVTGIIQRCKKMSFCTISNQLHENSIKLDKYDLYQQFIFNFRFNLHMKYIEQTFFSVSSMTIFTISLSFGFLLYITFLLSQLILVKPWKEYAKYLRYERLVRVHYKKLSREPVVNISVILHVVKCSRLLQ